MSYDVWRTHGSLCLSLLVAWAWTTQKRPSIRRWVLVGSKYVCHCWVVGGRYICIIPPTPHLDHIGLLTGPTCRPAGITESLRCRADLFVCSFVNYRRRPAPAVVASKLQAGGVRKNTRAGRASGSLSAGLGIRKYIIHRFLSYRFTRRRRVCFWS